MATLPIHLEVEDVAVGPVLIALKRMPGIIKMNLDIGGPAPKQHGGGERAPTAKTGSNAERVIALLMQRGPTPIADIIRLVGGSKGTAYTAMYKLKKSGVAKNAGVGIYELTDKARRDLVGGLPKAKLLPSPKNGSKGSNGHDVARFPKGRALPGVARKLLLDMLSANGARPIEIAKHLAGHGISTKGLSGLLERARRDEIIKKVGNNYELTSAGKKAQQQSTTETGE